MPRLGEFELRERLGEGGFATVWRADQPALGRDAVVKVLHARGEGERFLAEVKLAAKLDHPYAAHVYAFGAEPDGTLWIAMERVRGTPLDELLLAAGPLPLERLVPLVDRLCEVVQTAHDQGIVHRDIKPANVMVLSRAGRLLPKLLDLGVAAPMGDGAGGARAGTPRYMAPETWNGAVDARADIYALGVLVFECLTGRPPFDGSSWYALAKAHAKKPVPPLGPGFPPALDAVLARAMAKKPEARYASAGELGAALRSAAGITETRAPLPALPAELRDAWLASAPQPLAEAVAVLDAAQNAHQALAAARELTAAVTRWLALVALCAASRAGTPAPALARELRRRALTVDEWLALAREQVAPARDRPEAFAVPELVSSLAPPPDLEVRAATEEELRLALAPKIDALAAWLRGVGFVLAYPLVRAVRGKVERWSGIRRAPRPLQAVAATLPEGAAVLVDAEGTPACVLAPLAVIAPPAPGAAEEVFLLEGPGRHGARLVAVPSGFERQDEAPWDFLRARLADDDSGPAPDEGAPWPGLAPFTTADAARYVGREREAQAFVNRLRVSGFLAVVGPSGAGKSSFVHAGVVPILPEGWRVATIRPGPDPEAAMARAEPCDVLVVDQLEELFTLCHDREAQLRFSAALAARPRVVATLRDDFLMRAEALPPLREPLHAGLMLLSTPAEDDLRRILVEPARRAGHDFDDPELPGEMARAVADHPGALALLSFTASRLWERRDRHFRRLLRRVYDETGGVGGALAAHAEETLASLRPDEQRLVREAFRRLVTPQGTRAVTTRADLLHVLGEGAERVLERLVAARLVVVSEAEGGAERIEVVHEALLDAWPRLVAWRREDAGGARLRAQLGAAARQWEERGRARGLLWRDDALAELSRWRRAGGEALTPVEDAFTATSLAEAARGRRRRTLAIGSAFAALSAGVVVLVTMNARTEEQRRQAQARLAELHEEQGRQALLAGQPDHALLYLAEAERLGRRRPATRYLVGSALRGRTAELTRFEGHTGVVWHLSFSPDGARVLTASEDKTARLWDAAGGKPPVTLAHDDSVWRATFSPDGALIATSSFDGKARLWKADGTLLHTLAHGDRVYAVAFSPDGRRLATSSRDKSAAVWDVATGARQRHHTDLGAVSRAAAWSPDGRELAVVTDGGILRVFGEDGAERLRIEAHLPAALWSVSYSPDGNRLATASGDRSAGVFSSLDGTRLASLRHNAQLFGATFDATGSFVVTASQDQTAMLWSLDAAGKANLVGSLSHPAAVYAAGFSRDGKLIGTAAGDGGARVFTLGGVPIAKLVGHRGAVRAVAFDPAGSRIAAGVEDGDVRLWRARSPAVLHELADRGHHPWVARLSPDGARIATSGTDLTIRMWSSETGLEEARFPSGEPALVVVFRPDGQRLARMHEKRVVVSTLDGEAPIVLAHEAPLSEIEFAPEGVTLVTAASDGWRSWDTRDGRLLRFVPGAAHCATFTPDGRTLAVCGEGGQVRFHDPESGALLRTVETGKTGLANLAFDPTGGRFVGAGVEHVAWIFATDGRLLAALEGHTSDLFAVAFSPDGHFVATTSRDTTVRLWDAATGKLLDQLEEHGGKVSSVQFDRDGSRLVSASFEGSALLWDLKPDDHSAEKLNDLVRCSVPFRLEAGQPLPISLGKNLCSDSL